MNHKGKIVCRRVLGKCVTNSCKRIVECFIALSSLYTESVVTGRHLSHGEIGKLMEVSITEMPISDMVFHEFLEIDVHAHTVDIRCSSLC